VFDPCRLKWVQFAIHGEAFDRIQSLAFDGGSRRRGVHVIDYVFFAVNAYVEAYL